ncbi:sensor histidine kinase [Actinomycetospora chiangmaiensis]|uniref:sensor histidine kinase n=1 Tax=Actinomycetospora chiangmaiensis TaxID=402650 RepID=UPI000371674C|nr:ATP-binding protein [Actinomycetospora chiangmaiensis]
MDDPAERRRDPAQPSGPSLTGWQAIADLHDVVVPRISLVGYGLAGLASDLRGDARRRAMQLIDDVDDILRDTRAAVLDRLADRDDGIDLGTHLRAVTVRAADPHRLASSFDVHGDLTRLDASTARHLRAVVLEAVGNAARHARARALRVTIEVGDELRLEVHDDGDGLPEVPPAGLGLSTMAARARVLGGTFDVLRASPTGTIVRWTVPLAPDGATS